MVLAAPQLSIAEGSSADPQQHMPAGLDFHGRAALVLGTAPEQRGQGRDLSPARSYPRALARAHDEVLRLGLHPSHKGLKLRVLQ